MTKEQINLRSYIAADIKIMRGNGLSDEQILMTFASRESLRNEYGIESGIYPQTGEPFLEIVNEVLHAKELTFRDDYLLTQYDNLKKKYPDSILLFRCGDFYEVIKQDAQDVSDILKITLTRKRTPSCDYNIAGFPHHALDFYLPKICRSGRRVAICEKLEDPKLSKKLVKRGISSN